MTGTPETVAPFVAHHLTTSARAIHVFLDRHDPVVEALFAGAGPRVQVTVCDAAWWAGRPEGRPDEIFLRQYWNTEAARRLSDADWIVHVDSDEFLIPVRDGAPDIGEALARVPEGIDWARIPNRERVQLRDQPLASIFDGVFRLQTADGPAARGIYGADAAFLKNGFSGHVRGKYAIRRDSILEVRQHEAAWPGLRGRRARRDTPPGAQLDDHAILHFDGWTPLHWAVKLLRRVEAGRVESGHGGRRNQLAYMAATPDPAARAALYDRLQVLGPRRAEALRAAGLLDARPFDPGPAIAAAFPGHVFDFDPGHFDARMIAADPAFFARNGLSPAAPG